MRIFFVILCILFVCKMIKSIMEYEACFHFGGQKVEKSAQTFPP